ncbi:hypothetical protein Cgig2_011396 [Carnegiea gigantea]|uniref:RING-type E3 ubiquitin transferase n=1 Tax=Carnegiea gigantea TaxID=171969 RepID=A0A9Q1KS07_9CARY|nr:hypothetical protein Cgig2_011396 [Carnegiea gigantea]
MWAVEKPASENQKIHSGLYRNKTWKNGRFVASHMDEYSSRRTAGRLVISRKSPSLVVRDSAQSGENNPDRDVQVCSRVGCSSRLTPMKGAQVGSPSEAKTSTSAFHSSAHGKDIIGSSSRTPVAINSRRFFSDQKKKLPSRVDTDSDTSSLQDESEEISESVLTSGKGHLRVHPEPEDHELAEGASAESSGPANRFVKGTVQKFGLGREYSQASSSSFAFKQANQAVKNSSDASRYNLRNPRCNSVSDFVPSGSSSSTESSLGRKRDIGRKGIGEPESSSSVKGKKMSGLILDDRRNDNSGRGISISDSRRTRELNAAGDNDAASARARRSNARTRLSNQENRNRLRMIESPLLTPPSPQSDTSLDAIGFSFDDPFIAQMPPSHANSFSRSGSGTEHPHPNRSGSPYEAGFARSFMNRDTMRQFNLDGIAEMLLALERIGREEEPTYEELLALEERMGTVSTGVPEEALTECLKKHIYQGTRDGRGNVDDTKCSICQEEYADGEQVARLSCDHRYHVECVHQWLRLKNWCPICKVSAAPSPSSRP